METPSTQPTLAETEKVFKDSEKQTKHQKRHSNRIQVACSKPANFYIFLAKMHLKEFETIELHSVGNATSTAALTSENLIR
jgi:hypothetical protein